MKWPKSITLVRHGQSEYNKLRLKKEKDERYQLFKKAFEENPHSPECLKLAEEMLKKFALNVSDYETGLTSHGRQQAQMTGRNIKFSIPTPDIVIVSPYLRTHKTFELMCDSWPELAQRKPIPDDRVREQEHGLSLLYNDWRLFEVFHPEQHALRNLLGPYWYQFPQGESVSQVRDRIRSFTSTLIREYAGKDVMVITHHLTILSFRANFERLSPEEFIRLDEEEKPKNCGVTIYKCNPDIGSGGKLEIDCYNSCFWDQP